MKRTLRRQEKERDGGCEERGRFHVTAPKDDVGLGEKVSGRKGPIQEEIEESTKGLEGKAC